MRMRIMLARGVADYLTSRDGLTVLRARLGETAEITTLAAR